VALARVLVFPDARSSVAHAPAVLTAIARPAPLFVAASILAGALACGAPNASIDAGTDAASGSDAAPACDPLARATGSAIAAGDLGSTGTPVALVDFCDAYGEALCTAPAGCGCGAEPPLNCVHFAAARCSGEGGSLSPEMLAAIDAGDAVYDPDAAGHVIQTIRDAATDCARAPAAIDLDFLVARTGAVHGALAPGATCDPHVPFACVVGSSCRNAGDFVFACSTAHARCDAFAVCEGTSLHAPRLVCAGDACDHGAPPGSACDGVAVCATSCVDARCACALDGGDTCAVDAECASGDCIAGTCGSPATHIEDACVDGQACVDGTCAGGLCRSWQCAGGWY
jgi:hypothetical protein